MCVLRWAVLPGTLERALKLMRVKWYPLILLVFPVVLEAGAVPAIPRDTALEPVPMELLPPVPFNGIPVRELSHHLVKLSYANAETALDALRMLGFTTVDPGRDPTANQNKQENPFGGSTGGGGFNNTFGGTPFGAPTAPANEEKPKLKSRYAPEQLPVIVRLPGPNAIQSGLVGAEASVTRGDLGISMIPSAATALAHDTVAADGSRLLVFYQPSKPEQLQSVHQLLEDVIDVSARQILVEGMVLEVSHDGLNQLGVQWFDQRAGHAFTLGSLSVGGGNTLNLVKDTASKLADQFYGKVQALVQDGKAEVLSRPSVLTLDNRQATIRVGTDIPIATSKDASSASQARVSFSFQYLPTGILLNVRPRANKAGSEVSMLIDTTVSSTVSGKDLEVKSSSGEVLASAPTIATRRVQTYARIGNNMPLIIGGLVSRDNNVSQDKVPLLGDLPVLGKLFGADKKVTSKREVIIVLTPTVMSDHTASSRIQPKDDDAFDSRDNELFRDSYRLRAEDVMDSRYIRVNRRFVEYRNLVRDILRESPELANREPFNRLAGNAIPGEEVFVLGMLYRLLERLDIGGSVDPVHMNFFSQDRDDAFDMHTLAGILGLDKGRSAEEMFRQHPGEALSLSFAQQLRNESETSVLGESRAKVAWVRCADRKEWSRLLWTMNQSVEFGEQYYGVLLQNAEDLRRLSRAIALKRLVMVNGEEGRLNIAGFGIGRTVALPDIKPTQSHMLTATVARYFFFSNFTMPAFEAEQERVFKRIDLLVKGAGLGSGAVAPAANTGSSK